MTDAGSASFEAAAGTLLPHVWRCLRRMGLFDDELDDVAQTVLVALFTRWSTLANLPPRELRFFAVAVATNTARNVLRERKRAFGTELSEDLRHPNADPSRELEERELVRELDAILREMNEERRQIFVLYELNDMTVSQIAEYLSIPEGTVASRITRARRDFAAALARRGIPEKHVNPNGVSQRHSKRK